MKPFRLLLSLCAAGLLLPAAHAQKIIEKSAPVGGQQQVVLDLPQATSIRIRGGSGQQLRLRAAVTINQNKLNDALQLSLRSEGDRVLVKSAFDEALLRTGQPGDCPTETGGSQTWNMGEGHNGQQAYRVCSSVEVEIEVPEGVALRVNTISANIEATGLTGPLEAKSISGYVDVTWPAARGAKVAFKTITGEVYTDQDIAFTNRKPDVPMVGYEVRGALGTPGPLVRLESISNDVYFRKRK
ncbi:hypothetical protein [Solirubrum puertoriconensis]|uniref:Adhesin domain-containing protein n=1 Tax=Solirubrum puertoriconensis TaxID=1751427 RepID=A0A9X0HNA9_SOLP1|nr:hypothetical protein [Solirubrum puertoriconensis]KUG09042.1 hypothetical protein ASU33_19655 [Solirubrum puertoriconensis]